MGLFIGSWHALERESRRFQKLVFTNGCFDILHVGHVRYLQQSRKLGDGLVVGINSDASVRGLNKAPDRPINGEKERAEILAALECVSFVTVFSEPTPLELILKLKPKILTKGGDWKIESIVGAKEVLGWGGEVHPVPFVKGYSTTAILSKAKGPVS